MIEMTINRKDFDKLLNKLDSKKQDEVIRKSLSESAQYLVGWIKTNRLSGPRPQFLGVVTNRLRSSITATPTIKSGNSYIAKVGTNVEYGRIHEYGGFTGKGYAVNMPARPFMRPAIEDKQNQELVLRDLRDNLETALEK
jgi:phage gpG-like protein